MEGRHAPVVPAPGRLVRGRERGADHHRVGAARDGLGDVAARRHAAVGDDVDVHTRLVEVTDTRPGRVRDRGRLRYADAEHAAGRARVTRADADEDADRAGAHQVQRGGVRRAAADDDRELELANELLQVERLARGVVRYMLGRDDGALHDEDV